MTTDLALGQVPDETMQTTPQTPRLARYPTTLSTGRPFTRKRGTSKTYESFDDLLREAGYKDTRIFTPEAERRQAADEERREREERERQPSKLNRSKGFVVSLLSNWMSGGARLGFTTTTPATSSRTGSPGMEDQIRRLPPSPLGKRSLTSSSTRINANLLHPEYNVVDLGTPASSTVRPAFARPRAHLKHAASSPHIPKRATAANVPGGNGNIRSRAAVPQPRAPLPQTWLTSFTNVIGNDHNSKNITTPPIAPTPGKPHSLGIPPRILLNRVTSGSVVVVSQASVVCSSSPCLLSPSSNPNGAGRTNPSPMLTPKSDPERDDPLWPLQQQPLLPIGDDDADEPTLINLLDGEGPARRQRSIRSLRECLGKNQRLQPPPPLPTQSTSMRGDYDDDWDEDYERRFLIHGDSDPGPKRKPLPVFGWQTAGLS